MLYYEELSVSNTKITIGDIHCSELLAVITKERFEKAKVANWDVEINFL